MARIFCWRIAAGLLLATGLALIAGTVTGEEAIVKNPPAVDMVQLPRPDFDGGMTLDQALLNRRSQRNFSERPLTLDQVGRILWAAQGVTSDRGFRTAPSAGALFPLEVYLVSGRTQDLAAGIYHYLPGAHQLRPRERRSSTGNVGNSIYSSKPAMRPRIFFLKHRLWGWEPFPSGHSSKAGFTGCWVFRKGNNRCILSRSVIPRNDNFSGKSGLPVIRFSGKPTG